MASKHINRIWAFLMAATLVTYLLGESGWASHQGRAAVGVMFTLAAAKAFFVAYDFMELRHAPALWKRLVLGWLMVVVGGIVITYLLGR